MKIYSKIAIFLQNQFNASFTVTFLHLVLRKSRSQPRSCFANCVFLALVFELLVSCIAMITPNKIILLLENTFVRNIIAFN